MLKFGVFRGHAGRRLIFVPANAMPAPELADGPNILEEGDHVAHHAVSPSIGHQPLADLWRSRGDIGNSCHATEPCRNNFRASTTS